MKRLLLISIVVVIVLLGLAATACESDSATPDGTTASVAETPDAAVTPEVTAEPTIPSDFTTYTAEEQLFNISYPSDWELGLSEIPRLEDAIREQFESLESGLPLEEASMIFLAGDGRDANVNIVVDSDDVSTLERAAEDTIRGLEESGIKDLQIAQVHATIGGREGVILDVEGTLSGSRTRALQALIIDRGVVWLVSCGASSLTFPSVEDTCNLVVRSLRVLR